MSSLYSLDLVPRPGIPGGPEHEPLPRGALVLTDDPEIAAELAERDVSAVLVPPEASTWDEGTLNQLVAGGGDFRHVRVISSGHGATWPSAPRLSLLAVQEAAFLAAKHLARAEHPASSLAVLVLDPLARGLPHPHSALLTGLVKSLVWELPRTRTHALVTDAATLPDALAQLGQESGFRPGLPVAYRGERSVPAGRWEERLVPRDEALGGGPDRGLVVVAVGGARGITARCVEGLPTPPAMLWLLGSTQPDTMAGQAEEISGTTGAEYVRRRRAANPDVRIGDVRQTYDRCRRSAESLSGIAALRRRFGADRVRYLGCDVTNAADVNRAARTILAATPAVDLLIHGAGISGARRLAAKDLATFRAIRDTKVIGYHNLKAAFRDPAPERWCTFSSVAGAFGLAGESDYGPANDLLNAAARYETAHTGRPEVAINWTLWRESGLGPRAGFTEYTTWDGQLGLLSDSDGQRLFNGLITAAVPVPLGGADLSVPRTRFPGLVEEPEQRPYLGAPSFVSAGTAHWELDLARHAHLSGHVRESQALVPGMLAVELAAEAAGYLTGTSPVTRFSAIRFRAPIAMYPALARYVLTATFVPDLPPGGVVRVGIHSQLPAGGANRRVPHFEVVVPVGPVTTPVPPTGNALHAGPGRIRASMSMSGLFDHVRDLRHGARHTSARWHPRLPEDRGSLSQCRIPWVLADALLQTGCATTTAGRYATPHSIGELTLHTTANDVLLADRGAPGIRLHAVHRDRTTSCTAEDAGEPLLTMTDVVLSGRSGTIGPTR